MPHLHVPASIDARAGIMVKRYLFLPARKRKPVSGAQPRDLAIRVGRDARQPVRQKSVGIVCRRLVRVVLLEHGHIAGAVLPERPQELGCAGLCSGIPSWRATEARTSPSGKSPSK